MWVSEHVKECARGSLGPFLFDLHCEKHSSPELHIKMLFWWPKNVLVSEMRLSRASVLHSVYCLMCEFGHAPYTVKVHLEVKTEHGGDSQVEKSAIAKFCVLCSVKMWVSLCGASAASFCAGKHKH